MARVDPITLQIIHHALVAAAEEMKINLTRTAYNPIIYEVLDFSVGLFDPDGEMAAQAAGLTLFLGNLGAAVKTVIADVKARGWEFSPGDVYLINDTYVTGTHLPDVVTVVPVFWPPDAGDGSGSPVLLGFAAARAHWLDIGGYRPGAWFSDTTEVYQEGLRLRSIRLYHRGEPDPCIFQILRDNLRYPDKMMGDLRAQIAACRTGARCWQELAGKFGANTLVEAVAELQRQGERKARAAIAALPKGEFFAEGFLDDDGVKVDRPRIRLRVEVTEDAITFDLTGSSPQCAGPVNCGPQSTLAACRIAFKALTDPLGPANDGYFRPLRLILPDDCFLNAREPAPASLYGSGPRLLIELIIRALAPVIPERVVAGQYGDICTFCLFRTPDGGDAEGFTFIEPSAGGWGAGAHQDGESVLIVITNGDTRNIPVEIIENKYPLRIEQYELRPDSGGAGAQRGGLGQIRTFRLLEPMSLTATFGRSKLPPWGLFGGLPGATNRVVLHPGSEREQVIQKITGLPLAAGDVVSAQTGGGGGFGDPLERDPERVLADVRGGYVSPEMAERLYGVVLRDGGVAVDQEATRRRRVEMVLADPAARRIVRHLARHGRATAQDLAGALGMDLAKLRSVLERLQRHNLVLELTPRGSLHFDTTPPESRFCLGSDVPDEAMS